MKALEGLRGRLTRLAETGAREEAERLARDVGHYLSRNDAQLVRDFAAAAADARDVLVAKIDREKEAAFGEGVLIALIELCGAFEASARSRQEAATEDRAARSAVRKRLNFDILSRLEGSSLAPGRLALQLRKHPTTISRALRELRNAGLVEVMGQESDDFRLKPYRLTPHGAFWLAERRRVRRAVIPAASQVDTDTSVWSRLSDPQTDISTLQQSLLPPSAWTMGLLPGQKGMYSVRAPRLGRIFGTAPEDEVYSFELTAESIPSLVDSLWVPACYELQPPQLGAISPHVSLALFDSQLQATPAPRAVIDKPQAQQNLSAPQGEVIPLRPIRHLALATGT